MFRNWRLYSEVWNVDPVFKMSSKQLLTKLIEWTYINFKKWFVNHLWNLQGSFSLKDFLFKHLFWFILAPSLSQRKITSLILNISSFGSPALDVVNCSLSVGWRSPDGDVYRKLNTSVRMHMRQSLLQTLLFFKTPSTIRDHFAPIKISRSTTTHKPVNSRTSSCEDTPTADPE